MTLFFPLSYGKLGSLNQEGGPVSFFSRTLQGSEINQSSVEKEVQAIVEAVNKWRHFLLGKHFALITCVQASDACTAFRRKTSF